MPLAYLRRSAFLWLVSYLGFLFLLRQWGTLELPDAPPLQARNSIIRDAALATFDRRLSKNHSAILSGLVFGERRRLPRKLVRHFRDAGAMHLLVASGSNVAFVAGYVAWICLFRLSRTHSAALGLLAAGIYVVIAGPDPPLVRGFLMASFVILGAAFARNSGAFQGLVLACWVLALHDPPVVFTASFQLSFLAAFGLVAGLSAWQPPTDWPKYPRGVAFIFLASLCAQIAIAPVLGVYFQQFSVAALFSNLVLLPFCEKLVGWGMLLALTDSAILGWLLGWALALFEWFVRSFASWQLFWPVDPPGPLFFFLYYAGVLALWCRRRPSDIMDAAPSPSLGPGA